MIQKLVFPFSRMNYRPSNHSELFPKLEAILEQKAGSSPLATVNILMSMFQLSHFPQSVLHQVFSPAFITNVMSKLGLFQGKPSCQSSGLGWRWILKALGRTDSPWECRTTSLAVSSPPQERGWVGRDCQAMSSQLSSPRRQPLCADCAPLPLAAGRGGGAGVPRLQRPTPRPALPCPHV